MVGRGWLLQKGSVHPPREVVKLGIEALVGRRDAGVPKGVVHGPESIAYKAMFQNPLLALQKSLKSAPWRAHRGSASWQ